jgi:pSer/pThr/pTyr-binding forkhead associated (FHA) protein
MTETERLGSLLTEFVEDARALDDAAFAKKHANAFLVMHRGDFKRPKGPQQTGTFMPPAPEVTADVTPIAFAIKRKPTSEFPFVSVGRVENNDIYLPDETISKFHAYFKEESGAVVLQDGRSRNGTFVNGEKIAARGEGPAVVIGDGSVVRFGTVSATFFTAPTFRKYVVDVGQRRF